MATGVYRYKLGDGCVRYYVKYRTSNGVPRTRRGFRSERARRPPADPDAGGGLPRRGRGGAGTFAERFDAWLEESFAAWRRRPGGAADLDASGRIGRDGADVFSQVFSRSPPSDRDVA